MRGKKAKMLRQMADLKAAEFGAPVENRYKYDGRTRVLTGCFRRMYQGLKSLVKKGEIL